ncbi:MAG: DUF2335 domain-containing protein [Firmicutes bacterium]|nr:DUF2335 domain-containing protein [Bacillota bacterium]
MKARPEDGNKKISKEIEELIEKVGDKEVASKIIAIAESFSGPLPHPKILAQYKEILPDAPERIIAMAEKQQEHRFNLEKNVIKGDIVRANRGLTLGFILFMIFGLGAIVLLAIGKNIQGYALLGTSLLGGIGNFIRVGVERAKKIRNDLNGREARGKNLTM